MQDFIGSKDITRYLSHLQADALPHHAFLFVGSEHVGKTYLANVWMTHLGIRDRIVLDSHKEDGSYGSISVEQVRDCVLELSRTSFSPSARAVFINRGDDLSESASNALLKSLEEPPPRTLFIILATDTRALLPTIVSRCFTLRLPLVSDAHLKGMIKGMSEPILQLACNRPGIAIELMANFSRESEEQSRLEHIRLCATNSFSTAATSSEYDEGDTSRIEAFLSRSLHDDKGGIPSNRITALFDSLSTARGYMRTHISVARALESVFL